MNTPMSDRTSVTRRSRNRKFLAVGSSTLLATASTGSVLLLSQGVAGANTAIVVDSLTDDGTGLTLREAIDQANSTLGQDEITFSVTGTITLTSDLPAITDALVITGPGPSSLTIDGDGQYRVLSFQNVESTMGTTAVTGVTIAHGNGKDNDDEGSGGAIQKQYGSADMLIRDVVLTENRAYNDGGAIHLYGTTGTVTIQRSIVTKNVATDGSQGGGGGLYASAGEGSLKIDIIDSTFSDNSTRDGGGGLYTQRADVTITNSVISGNTVSDGDGGGATFYKGTVTMVDTTVDSNTSPGGGGGGIKTKYPVSAVVLNSTVSNNTAGYYGGGLYLLGTTAIVQTTISGNSGSQAGAVYVGKSGGAGILLSTITDNEATNPGSGVAVHGLQVGSELSTSSLPKQRAPESRRSEGHHAPSGAPRPADAPPPPGTIQTIGSIIAGNGDLDIAGYGSSPVTDMSMGSLLGTLAAEVTVVDGGGNHTGVTAAQLVLGPLADNGGPTKTHALLPGSIAIDAGPAAADVPSFPGSAFDQRGVGYDRIVGGVIDVGSFEVQPPPAPAPQPEPDVAPKFTG